MTTGRELLGASEPLAGWAWMSGGHETVKGTASSVGLVSVTEMSLHTGMKEQSDDESQGSSVFTHGSDQRMGRERPLCSFTTTSLQRLATEFCIPKDIISVKGTASSVGLVSVTEMSLRTGMHPDRIRRWAWSDRCNPSPGPALKGLATEVFTPTGFMSVNGTASSVGLVSVTEMSLPPACTRIGFRGWV
jgi:hypothetical protein